MSLSPENYLSNDDQKRLSGLEERLRELALEREPLAAKLAKRTHTSEEMLEITRLNREITSATMERQTLLDKNPMLAKNVPGFRG